MHETTRQLIVPFLSLFTSTGTLLCCALPALLVTLGAGAALAGFVSAAPWLVALSQYKVWLFTIAGILLAGAGVLQYRARYAPCPADPQQARACTQARKISAWIYWISVAIYAVGFFFAFIASVIMY
jgi:hypothetical protein